MARARRNPRGFRPPSGVPVRIVRVGKHGIHTHLFNPHTGIHACKSGVNAGRGGESGACPEIYATDAKTITCYRCAKLAEYNLARFKTAVPQGAH